MTIDYVGIVAACVSVLCVIFNWWLAVKGKVYIKATKQRDFMYGYFFPKYFWKDESDTDEGKIWDGKTEQHSKLHVAVDISNSSAESKTIQPVKIIFKTKRGLGKHLLEFPVKVYEDEKFQTLLENIYLQGKQRKSVWICGDGLKEGVNAYRWVYMQYRRENNKLKTVKIYKNPYGKQKRTTSTAPSSTKLS